MLFGDIVNVFIGLALTFATLGLIVSAITEAFASIFKWRANSLLAGLKALLNDPNLDGLAGDLLNHAAVNPRGPGGDVDAATSYALRPSYIPATQFAAALIDVIERPPASPAVNLNLKAAIASVSDAQLRSLFQGIYERTAGDIGAFHSHLATWFDASMERLSGDYKRRTQWVSFLIGLVIAIVLNVNSFDMARAFWAHPTLVQQAHLVDQGMSAGQALQVLETADFPFGWKQAACDARQPGENPTDGVVGCATTTLRDHPFNTIFGLLATAISLVFGAPFWFDLLQRFVQLRGTGAAPDAAPAPSTRPHSGVAP
ncbi:hypothetical protein [Telmatospirillum sp.]|uniref:hypothetical protein n=1 Tax=Telmatospirillum sp. TaxID=2079197 RepID=UPI00284005BA|nr:hypothetical protein [Telmatospirillum sp.]MDR3436701.1 hypothetical protein [Telmatospirillum sp.]